MRVSPHALLLLGALCAPISAYSSQDRQQQPLGQPFESTHSHHETHHDYEPPSYRTPLLSLHRALVEVPSISGSEGDAALLLRDLLTKLNYTVTLQRVPFGDDGETTTPSQARYNVLAWPGLNAPRTFNNRVLITSHIDVVPPYIPYHLNRTRPPTHINFPSLHPDTLISGRGTVDAKASVAAQITATSALLSSGSISPEDIVLLYVVGEETSGVGMKYFSSALAHPTGILPQPGRDDDLNNKKEDILATARPQFRAAVFGEPTENKLACGHKGITSGIVTAVGKAGHSGYPWLGKSATAVLVRALDRLLGADLGSSERYGRTTVNVGVIEGGVAANVIAERAVARVAVRIAVGNRTTGGGIVKEGMQRVLEEVDGEALRLDIAGGIGYGPVECECDVDGFETMVANYGTDVPNLEGDHVSYLYGPGSILVAHGGDEGLTVRELEESVEGYKRLIKHAVGAHK